MCWCAVKMHHTNLFQICWSSSFFVQEQNWEQLVMGHSKFNLTLTQSFLPSTWHWTCSWIKSHFSSAVCMLWVGLLTLPAFSVRMAVPLSCSPSYLALLEAEKQKPWGSAGFGMGYACSKWALGKRASSWRLYSCMYEQSRFYAGFYYCTVLCRACLGALSALGSVGLKASISDI